MSGRVCEVLARQGEEYRGQGRGCECVLGTKRSVPFVSLRY